MIDVSTMLRDIHSDVKKSTEERIKHKIEETSKKTFSGVLDSTIAAGSKTSTKHHAPVDKKLMEACVDMESIFVAKMFKEMRKAVPKTNWIHGGFAEEIFEDMLYDQYSKNLSKNSPMGLAKVLYDDLSGKKREHKG